MTGTELPRPHIVVGIDGSEGSKDALRWAARMAQGLGVGVEAVAIWDFPSTYGWSSLPPLYPPHPPIEKLLNEAVDEVFGPDRPVDLEVRVIEGPTVPSLLAATKGALMLVVGSRGLGGVSGLLLGSVSAQVAEHATCPVLVVHGDGPPAPASSS